MKALLSVLAAIVFAISIEPNSYGSEKASEQVATGGSATEKEILEAEKQFAAAVQAHDSVRVAEMLADYYADAIDGSERAMPKGGAVARAKAGLLPTYAIVKDQRITENSGMVTVEGLAKATVKKAGDVEIDNEWLYIRRIWTKKEGHYVLVSQSRREVSEAVSKEK